MHCAICQLKIKKRPYFRVPKCDLRRNRWIVSCGVNLVYPAIVCQYHFQNKDFINEPGTEGIKLQRLQPGAVPKVLIEQSFERKTTQEKAINDENDNLDTVSISSSTATNSIVTSIKAPPKIEFINVQCPEQRKIVEPVLRKPSKFKPKRKVLTECKRATGKWSIGVQTGSSITGPVGRIEVTEDNMVYIINCLYCKAEFPIRYWLKFVQHMQKHQQNPTAKVSSADEHNFIDKNHEKTNSKTTAQSRNVEIVALQHRNINVTVPKMNPQFEIVVPCKLQDTSVTNDFSDPFEDDDEKMYNDNKNIHDDDDDDENMYDADEMRQMADENDIKKETKKESTFKTDSAIATDFLDILKSHPILWQARMNEDIATYDAALKAVTTKMNGKWKQQISEFTMYQSLDRVKKWFRQLLESNTEGLEEGKRKSSAYLKKCAELLPNYVVKCNTKEKLQPAFECKHCQTILKTKTQLMVHLFTVHKIGEKPFKCRFCVERFDCAELRGTHFEQKHPGKFAKGFVKKTCDKCNRKFSGSQALRNHMARHKPPNYQCEICSKLCYDKFQLKYHMQFHSGKRNFVCEFCGKTFFRKQHMMEHIRGEHEKIAYACNICDCEFYSSSQLSKHRQTFHRVLEGLIEDLDKKQRRKPRSNYEYVHDPVTNELRLKCDICGNPYRNFTGLCLHKSRVHRQ